MGCLGKLGTLDFLAGQVCLACLEKVDPAGIAVTKEHLDIAVSAVPKESAESLVRQDKADILLSAEKAASLGQSDIAVNLERVALLGLADTAVLAGFLVILVTADRLEHLGFQAKADSVVIVD